jgi:hypothetical protein
MNRPEPPAPPSRRHALRLAALGLAAGTLPTSGRAHAAAPDGPPRSFSGIYPHLATSNRENECGTGAVVPWAGRLWVVSYGPHLPRGSSDKLHEIEPDTLRRTVRPESVGGTPANRLIHSESNQLFIGPYVIDEKANVRVIPPKAMPGRHTATVRHLADPARKVYYATMEEGLYEVDVHSLQIKTLHVDANEVPGDHAGALLPGYHGKGAYSGQGVLVYANNGERSDRALSDPTTTSGCLAEWDGDAWRVVRRNQFCEVTGPGGIAGNAHPESDPIWSIGWDHRSLLLALRDRGAWSYYRLPKASGAYDGAHGWNTEWPRIRDVGEADLLMTMHGAFWTFPRTFTRANTAGLAMRSTYLKVVGDFCRWGDSVVLGCDDSARSEFLNRRKLKGALAPPAISNSNLWIVAPETLDRLGPARGRGAAWLDEPVAAGTPSDPFLLAGFARRGVLLAADAPAQFTIEADPDSRGTWEPARTVRLDAPGTAWVEFRPDERLTWARVRVDRDLAHASSQFCLGNPDARPDDPDPRFAGLARPDTPAHSGGLLHVGGTDRPLLRFAATTVQAGATVAEAAYTLDEDLVLRPAADPGTLASVRKAAPVPSGVVGRDAASLVVRDDRGRPFRLPSNEPEPGPGAAPAIERRVCREVCTERDLLHVGGIFYELPAENAGGFAGLRPIAAHPFAITDYCSWRGLLVLAGINEFAPENPHIIRSEDGRAALWLGVVDDLWSLGRPRGVGGPWRDTAVEANVPSDPYLFTGFARRRLAQLRHDADAPVAFRIELDLTGAGLWVPYRTLTVAPRSSVAHDLPDALDAPWLRLVADRPCRATAQFRYDAAVPPRPLP